MKAGKTIAHIILWSTFLFMLVGIFAMATGGYGLLSTFFIIGATIVSCPFFVHVLKKLKAPERAVLSNPYMRIAIAWALFFVAAIVSTSPAPVSAPTVSLSPSPSIAATATPAPVEETIVTSIKLDQEGEITLDGAGETFISFAIITPADFSASDVRFSIAPAGIITTKWNRKSDDALWFTITAVKPGEASFQLQTLDGTVKSDTLSIVVAEPEETASADASTPAPEATPEPEANSELEAETSESKPSEHQSGSTSNTDMGNAEIYEDDSQDQKASMVWVPTNGGRKYHSKSSCSNMDDPIQVTKEQAEADGFTQCKRCW